MLPTDKVTEAEVEDPTASAIHPFDRYINSVYARKDDNPFPIQGSAHEGAGGEPQSLSDNVEASPAGLDRLRAEILTRAREAEEREREAIERGKQLEAKYKQEQALRRLAEQRA